MKSIAIFIDESGNLGRGAGRYFSIGFVVVDAANVKTIHRRMKRESLFIKQRHPGKSWPNSEVKAAYLDPEEKQLVLTAICKPDIKVYSITVDKEHVRDEWLNDQASFYNFMSKDVIDAIVDDNPDLATLTCFLDARTIQVQSRNSFEDYMKIHLNYERKLYDIQVISSYVESHRDFGIQTADFIANAINQYYLSGKHNLMAFVEPSIVRHQFIPADKFGQ